MNTLRELKSLSPSVGDNILPCKECNATGGVEPPKDINACWGKTLINGMAVCMGCDGTGVEGGRAS